MKTYAVDEIDADVIVEDLLNGDGVVRLTGLCSPEEIAEARRFVMEHPDRDAGKVTQFQGADEAEGTIALQRRAWHLLAKGEVSARMVAHPASMAIPRRFLGTEFIMGSIAANRILPSGPGDLALVFGAVCHRAMPNRSDHECSAILTQYPPEWVKPMEVMPAALPAEEIEGASPDLRQLPGLNYPYHKVPDTAAAGNTAGPT